MSTKHVSNTVAVNSTIALAVRRRRRSVLDRAAFPLSMGLLVAGGLAPAASAGPSVSYTPGITYTQNFNGLPNPGATFVNTSNTPTINGVSYFLPAAANTPFDFTAPTGTEASNSSNGLNVSTMPGWYGYGATGTGNLSSFGAQAGSQTRGGVISFGAESSSDRSLGLLATSATNVTEFGVEFINNGTTSLNQISMNYAGELWHQGAAKNLVASYEVTSATAAMPLPGSGGLITLPSAYTVSDPSGTLTTAELTAPIYNSSFGGTSTPISNWAPGQALWITWSEPTNAGSAQGFSIDNLNFNASTASGANITWNTGTGTWDASSANWLGGSPSANLYKEGDFVTFGNIASDSTITVASLTNGGVTPSSTTITNTAHTYTFQGGSINGQGSLTMNGSGGVAVLAAANNYSGGTFVTAGTLVADSDAALGLAGDAITLNGGTLKAGAALTSTRSITVSGSTGTSGFNTGGFNSVTGGALILNDSLTVTGVSNAGGLEINGTVTFGATSSLNIQNGATVTFNQASGTINQANNSTYNGTLLVNGAVRLNFNGNSSGGTATSAGTVTNGIVSGTGVIDIANPGTVAPITTTATSKDPSVTYNGNPTSVAITNTSSTQGGQINVPIVLNSANQYTSGTAFSRFDVTQAVESPGNFTVSIGGTNGSTSNDPSIQDGYGITINGAISGNSDVNLANSPLGGGGGYLLLNASNTYTGATLVNTSNLIQIGVSNALPVGTDLVFGTIPYAVGGSTILDLNGYNQSIASLSSGTYGTHKNQITDSGSTNSILTVGSISSAATPALPFEGEIEDGLNATVSVQKIGSSGLSLSGANSYSGFTNVSGGTFTLTSTGTLASGAYTVASGATLVLQGNFNALSPTTSSNAVPNITTAGATVIGPFALSGNASTGVVQVQVGALNIASTGLVTVTDPGAGNHSSRTLVVAQTLSLAGSTGAWAGQLDLAGNDMLIHAGSLSDITNQLKQGYNGGTWQGSGGIVSSTAAADTSHLTAIGAIQNVNANATAIYNTVDGNGGSNPGAPALSTDILLKYTYYGDANLDGVVDGSDYSLIDSAFLTETNTHTAVSGWYNGDFNYDGVVNGSDYTLIDNAFNTQGAALTSEIAAPTAQIAGNTSVPEPAGLLAILALTQLCRRRKVIH